MDLQDLKIRTIHGVYRKLPLDFQEHMAWKEVENDLIKNGTFGIFAQLARAPDFSSNITDTLNMEYVASVAECTSKLDLIQLTSIYILSTLV